MLAGGFAPTFPIVLIEKDFGLAIATGATVGAQLPVTEAVRAVFAAAKTEGYADENITGVVQRYIKRSVAPT